MDLSAWKHEILKGERDGVKNLIERRRFNNAKRQAMLSGGESWFNVKFNGVTITVNFEPSYTPERVKHVIREKFRENDVELSDYFDLEREDTGKRLTQNALYTWKEIGLRVIEPRAVSSSSIGGESKSSGRSKQPSPYEYVGKFNERIHEYKQRIAKLKHQRHQRHRQELQEIRRAVRDLSTFERDFAEKRQHPVFMVGYWSDAAIARWCTGSKGTKNKLKSPDPDWDWLRRRPKSTIKYKARALFAKFCASQALPSVRDQGHKTIISDLKKKLQAEDRTKMDKQIKNFEIPNMGEIRVLVIERLLRHTNPNCLKKQELDEALAVLKRCHNGIVLGKDHMDDVILSAERRLETFHQLAKDIVNFADTQSLEEGPKQKMLGALLYLGYYGKALEERLKSLKNIQKGSKNARHQIDKRLRNIRRALEQADKKTRQQDSARNRTLSEMYHPQEAGWKEVKGASRSPAASDRGGESKQSASSGTKYVFRTHSHDSGDEEPIGDMGVTEQLAQLSVKDESSSSSNKIDADKCRGCDKNPSGDDRYCRNCTDILKRLGVPPNETDEHYVRGIMRIFSLSKTSNGKKRKSGKKKKGSQKKTQKNQKNQKKLVCDVDWSRKNTASFAKWLCKNENVIELIIKSIHKKDKMWTYIVGNDVSNLADLSAWLQEIKNDGNFHSWTPNMCMYYAALFKKDMDVAVGAAVRVGESSNFGVGDKREIWFDRAWFLVEHSEYLVKVRILERIIAASPNPYHLYIWRTRLFELQKDDENFNLENAQELEKMLQDLMLYDPDNRSFPLQLRMVLGSILPRVIGEEGADIIDIVELHFKILDADLATMFDDELTEEILYQRYESTMELLADVVDKIDDEHSQWINTKKLELYRMKWEIKTRTGGIKTKRRLKDLMKESVEKYVTFQVEDYGTLARLAEETLGDAY